jgi:hypothetical protein
LVINFSPVAVTVAVADDIVLETAGLLPIDGNEYEELVLKRNTTV